MTEEALRGYTFDTKTHTYIDNKTGKPIKAALLALLLRQLVQEAEARQSELATAFYEGNIAPASFVEQTRTEQQRNVLISMALAAGGFAMLDSAMLSKANLSLQDTYSKVIGTTRDTLDGNVSLPQLLNRIGGYVGAARSLYYETARDNAPLPPDDMVAIERRVLGDADHCEQCPQYADWGWQLAGEIPLPSEQCDCEDHCRCHNEIANVPRSELDQWITKEKTVVEWTPRAGR